MRKKKLFHNDLESRLKGDSNSNISLTQGDKEKFVFSMLGEFFSMKKVPIWIILRLIDDIGNAN